MAKKYKYYRVFGQSFLGIHDHKMTYKNKQSATKLRKKLGGNSYVEGTNKLRWQDKKLRKYGYEGRWN